ncbi:hypothetical protein ACS0TY_011228 [Phlomoides rotata]
MACFILHNNYIRNEMSVDPAEVLFDNSESGQDESAEIPDVISTIELTTEWTGWRTLAQEMFQEFMDGFKKDMFSQQSNGFGTGSEVPKKGSRGTRRIWSHREEKIRIAALKDLIAKGQKLIMVFVPGT